MPASLIVDMFFSGSLLTLAVYCLFFGLCRKNFSTINLGCLCIVAVLLYLMPLDRFFIGQSVAFSRELASKLEQVCLFLSITILATYIASMYPQVASLRMQKWLTGFGLFCSILIFFAGRVSSFLMVAYAITVVALCIYFIFVLRKISPQKTKGATWLLFSFLLLIVITINDFFRVQGSISTGRFLPFGLFLFIFAQSLILFQHFTNLFVQVQAYECFVPKEFLKNLGIEDIGNVKLGYNVEKTMSILFSDIRSFTQLSEKMTPEENFNFINSYLTVIGPVIRNHLGFVDKFIGDGIMALFDRSADDALRCAIKMIQTLGEYNQGRKRAGYTPVSIGIGINTGSLRIGTVGDHQRMDATVISDAVNLASRIEAMTKNYGVSLLISETTYDSLEDPSCYNLRKIDRVKVRGKENWVTLWEVFDVDSPEIVTYKLELSTLFDEAVICYQERKFKEAYELFMDCHTRNPLDKPAHYFIEKCKLDMKIDTGEDGSGITRRVIYERR